MLAPFPSMVLNLIEKGGGGGYGGKGSSLVLFPVIHFFHYLLSKNIRSSFGFTEFIYNGDRQLQNHKGEE